MIDDISGTRRYGRVQRILSALLASMLMVFSLGLVGCAQGPSAMSGGNAGTIRLSDTGETRLFTDSIGRTVEIPAQIDRIAPSGNTAQMVLLTMAPERMVGLAGDLTEDQSRYLSATEGLPTFGALYGSRGTLNKEALAAADPQVIIDTGEMLDGIDVDMDDLQEQMGIPWVYIETTLDKYGEAYRLLGELLGMPERGQQLSEYCESAYQDVLDTMEGIPDGDRVDLAYLLGDEGLNAIAKDSYQGQVIDLCANNVAVLENPTGAGTGTQVDFEQIAIWDPDLIIFGPDSIYEEVLDAPLWDTLTAVQEKRIYQVPDSPYNWLNMPPTVNQVMGMQWLPRLLYPDAFDDSIEDVAREYYRMFYQYELSDEELDELLVGARPL